MNSAEQEYIIGQAVRIVGKRLGFEDLEFYSYDEVLESIKGKDEEIGQKLQDFIIHYSNWFEFHRRNHELGKADNLDSVDSANLQNLISKRNSSRNKLLDILRKIH